MAGVHGAPFIAASLLLAVTPGPGVVRIVTRTLADGRGAGFASLLGVACTNLLNSADAALGLATLLAVSRRSAQRRRATLMAALGVLGAASESRRFA